MYCFCLKHSIQFKVYAQTYKYITIMTDRKAIFIKTIYYSAIRRYTDN